LRLKPKLLCANGKDASRARIVHALTEDDDVVRVEYDRALIYMQYFGYLKRDPDAVGVSFWVEKIAKEGGGDYHDIARSFTESSEYRLRFQRLGPKENQR